jgi:hypothetical protein
MSHSLRLGGKDAELILEALAYMGRRFFDPSDRANLLEIESRLEEIRQLPPDQFPVRIRLGDSLGILLSRALATYVEMLDRPSSSPANVSRIVRIRRLNRRLVRSRTAWGAVYRWLGLD